MNSILQSHFDLIEKQKDDILNAVKPLTEAERNLPPHPGKWSINQIIAHLITAEKMTLSYMQKKVLAIDKTKNAGLLEELKMVVLYLSQRLPLKFNAPNAIVERTTNYGSLDQIEKDWQAIRKDLRNFYASLRDDQINRKIYKHIIAGRLSAKHSLIFIHEHSLHHLPQVKRLIN